MKISYTTHISKSISTVLIAVLLFVLPVVINAQSFTAFDGFDDATLVFGGTMSGSGWANNSWIREGENGIAQDVRVIDGSNESDCDFSSNVLELKDNDAGAYRLIDLSAATYATLSFLYDTHRQFDGDETLLIQIDPENDGTYSTLLTIPGRPGASGLPVVSESFSIPAAYLGGSSTRIRFITGADNHANQNNEKWWIDNVEVAVNQFNPCDAAASGNLDSDGDGISDVCDLDDDNDGILDSVEGCGPGGGSGSLGIGTHFTSGSSITSANNGAYATTVAGIGANYAFYKEDSGDRIRRYYYNPNSGGQGNLFLFTVGENKKASVDIVFNEINTGNPTIISGGKFKITDFDEHEQVTVDAYDQNGNLIILKSAAHSYTSHYITSLGSQIVHQDGNLFTTTNNPDPNVSGDNVSSDPVGSVIFDFSGQLISRIKISTHHVRSGGSSIRFTEVKDFCRPLDTDGDGIPDHLDTDSDNDGCFDAIEAAGNITSAQLDAEGRITGGVDANGVPLLVNGGQATLPAVTASDVISQVTISPDPAIVLENTDITLSASPTGIRVTDFGATGGTNDDTTIAIPLIAYIYKWYLGTSTTPLSDNTTYSGTSTANLTISNASLGLSNNIYRVEVTTAYNNCPVENQITLIVYPPLDVSDIEACPGTIIDLGDALESDIPLGYVLEWWTTEDRQSGTQVSDPADVVEGVYYAFFVPQVESGNNLVASDPVNVSYSDIQLSLLKSSTIVDVNNNGFSDVGDIITYNFTIINSGTEVVNNLVINDAQIGMVNVPVTPSTINVGQQISVSFNYAITAADIQNKSVYNLATIEGETPLNCLVTVTSVDPIPLNPAHQGYDPARPNHTYTQLNEFSLCFDEVEGSFFKWNTSSTANGPTYSRTITQPGTNAGFAFDIYELDNSFNMQINGVNIATWEIEFQRSPGLTQNIRFTDGSIWQSGGILDIWRLRGATDKPIIRIIISPFGQITMLGSKVSASNPAYVLEPLQLFNGNTFNIINWNTVTNNTIRISQNIVGPTVMDGYGIGQNIADCETYTLMKEGLFNDENKDGIAQLGETIRYTLTVKNAGDIDIYNLKVNDPMLGGEIVALPAGDLNSNGILDSYEEWVYTVNYVIKEEDITNKGVYNLATVTGKNELDEDLDMETSLDPTPLNTSDPNYDPNRPNHTFVPLKQRSLLITNPNIYQRLKNN